MGKVEDTRALKDQLRRERTAPGPAPTRARTTGAAPDGAAPDGAAPDGAGPARSRRVALDRASAPEAAAGGSAAPPADLVPTDVCGHRSMGNKVCTRPKDHPEKNHRYSTR